MKGITLKDLWPIRNKNFARKQPAKPKTGPATNRSGSPQPEPDKNGLLNKLVFFGTMKKYILILHFNTISKPKVSHFHTEGREQNTGHLVDYACDPLK